MQRIKFFQDKNKHRQINGSEYWISCVCVCKLLESSAEARNRIVSAKATCGTHLTVLAMKRKRRRKWKKRFRIPMYLHLLYLFNAWQQKQQQKLDSFISFFILCRQFVSSNRNIERIKFVYNTFYFHQHAPQK